MPRRNQEVLHANDQLGNKKGGLSAHPSYPFIRQRIQIPLRVFLAYPGEYTAYQYCRLYPQPSLAKRYRAIAARHGLFHLAGRKTPFRPH